MIFLCVQQLVEVYIGINRYTHLIHEVAFNFCFNKLTFCEIRELVKIDEIHTLNYTSAHHI